MAQRDPKTLLREQAIKKPDLQKLLDSVNELTQDDIDILNHPLWIKKALYQIKLETNIAKIEWVDGETPDVIGKIYKWTGGEQWVKINSLETVR